MWAAGAPAMVPQGEAERGGDWMVVTVTLQVFLNMCNMSYATHKW